MLKSNAYQLSDFDFDLPDTLIAQYPMADRTASRLLHVDDQNLRDHPFTDIVNLLDKNDLLVLNNTKVLKARLFGQKLSGAKVEILVERILSHCSLLVHMRANRPPKSGSQLLLENHLKATVNDRQNGLYVLDFEETNDIAADIEQYGHLPLPPYITRTVNTEDEARYQTVFAENPGAVAAPTAGLHFDDPLLTRLKEKGVQTAFVTLHVGAGTFQPIRGDLQTHQMHRETYTISTETAETIALAKKNGKRIVACGTTTLRALESAANEVGDLNVGTRETHLFIQPGYDFKVVDRLITNFHLPKTTLLILVSAFSGTETIRKAYQHAIDHQYRFFSYGDAMLLEKKDAI